MSNMKYLPLLVETLLQSCYICKLTTVVLQVSATAKSQRLHVHGEQHVKKIFSTVAIDNGG